MQVVSKGDNLHEVSKEDNLHEMSKPFSEIFTQIAKH